MGKKILFWVAVILAGVILAVSGCGPAEWHNQQWSDGTQPTVEAVDVGVYGTMAALEVQEKMAHLDATAQAGIVQATMEAIRAQADVHRLAATRQAAAATSSAWDRYLQATSAAHEREIQLTAVAYATQEARAAAATAQAMSIEATRAAYELEATRQQEQWNREATATAQARADVATAQAWAAAMQATGTAQVVQATRDSHQATATRAAEIREENLGYARDYGLPLLGFCLMVLVILAGVWIAREWRKRPIVYPRSLLGDAEPMAVRRHDGGYTLIDLDRQPGPVLQLLPSGDVDAPKLRSAGQEERTTARDQLLDATTRPRLGGGHSSQAPVLPEPPQAAPEGLTGVRILRRLDQAPTAGLLPPGQVEAIEAVWREVED